MGTSLDINVRASAASCGKTWEAVRSRRVILTYGSVACDRVGQAGEVGHVLTKQVYKVKACVLVLQAGEEGVLFVMDQKPVATMIGLDVKY